MKKSINFLAIPKQILVAIIVVFALAISLTSCEKDWPNLTDPTIDEGTSVWVKNGYSLKSAAAAVRDTLILYKGVESTFVVVNANNEAMGNVVFTFGDGFATTGSTVSHAYSSTGKYTLSANVNGTIISGPIRVILFGEPISDECVINIYHKMVNGQSQDTIGLAISNIYKANSQGTWFITGDFNSWPEPQSATALTQIRTINGKKYLIWGITHPVGLEKFNYGKVLADGDNSWNYSPKSLYWHANAGGGELWIYFTTAGISHLPEGSTLPGTFGDSNDSTWVFRHSLVYGTNTATLTSFVHKTMVINPSNPEFVYKLGENGTWTSKALTDGTNYTVSLDNIPYGTIVYYYVLAKAGDMTTKIALGTSGYNNTASACLLQINVPL